MPRTKQPVFETAFGTYRSERLIGQGGAGRVFAALDMSGRKWAVKVLDPNTASSDKLKRFKNEYAFSTRFPHKNLVGATDYGATTIDGVKTPFFVMPYFDSSLRGLLNSHSIAADNALPLFSQILDGVESAHLHSVIHRDLKPENILYASEEKRIVIADFGIAQFATDELFTFVETAPRTRLANFQYSAPEQRVPGRNVDVRTDIYALGLILNEMFTGEIPHGTGYRAVASVAPPFGYVDDLISTMLRQNPDERPASIEIVKTQLIGRGNAFIERQKLDSMKSTVISTGTVSDRLIDNPPHLVDAHWDGEMLTLTLSSALSDKWVWALQNLGSYTSAWGKDPGQFRITGNKASIGAKANEVQPIVDYFKNWLPRVNAIYAEAIRTEARNAEDKSRDQLQRAIAAAELRGQVNRSLKI